MPTSITVLSRTLTTQTNAHDQQAPTLVISSLPAREMLVPGQNNAERSGNQWFVATTDKAAL